MTTYLTNSLLDLKKEALIAQDLVTLQLIRDFEKSVKIYFKIIDCMDILDSEGKPVNVSHSIFDILEGFHPATNKQKPPGTLIKLIQERQKSILIVEVGKDFKFPVQRGFDWCEYMTDQPVASSLKREINGVGFYTANTALFVSAQDLDPDELEQYINQFSNNKQ